MQRTIQDLLNKTTGIHYKADDLLRDPKFREAEIFQLRNKIATDIQSEATEYVCNYCKQPVTLKAIYNKTDNTKDHYFAHLHDSDDCIYKVDSRYTEEEVRRIKYNGVKEGEQHIVLKNQIAYYLQTTPGVQEVDIEKVYRDKAVSKEWRKPDVLAKFEDKSIAFELQLSTTFLSVIVARTLFYQHNNVFLLWVFDHFSIDQDVQKFTQKDVYYSNNVNVYVFDKEAQHRSSEAGQLILRCYHQAWRLDNWQLEAQWESTFISISDLQFNHQSCSFHYYDSEAEKQKLQQQIRAHQSEQHIEEEKQRAESKADFAVGYLKRLYHDERGCEEEDGCLDDIQSDLEIELLNEKLGFYEKNAAFISKLFVNQKKPKFLELICSQDCIHLNTAALRVGDKTMLQYLLEDNSDKFFRHCTLLFRKGYTLTNADFATLDDIFANNNNNSTVDEIWQIQKWAFVKGLNGIWYKEYTPKLSEIRKFFFAIMSLKSRITIGLNYKNLRQLSHKVLQEMPQHGMYFIKAMKVFGEYHLQLRDDKSGKLRQKIDHFICNPPPQVTTNDYLLDQIFPEIAEAKNL